MSETLTYDQIDLLADTDPIALRDLAWKLLNERDTARAEPPGRCGNQAPSLFRNRPLSLYCNLRAGHAGWHETDGGMSWTHGPDTEADLRARLDAAMAIVRDYVDDDPCDYDHHDYCQTHGLHNRPCVNERATALIAAVDQTVEPEDTDAR